MNGSQEDSVEVEEAALAELERELEQRWGESWQIALYILFVSQRGESMTVSLSETKFAAVPNSKLI